MSKAAQKINLDPAVDENEATSMAVERAMAVIKFGKMTLAAVGGCNIVENFAQSPGGAGEARKFLAGCK
eukprot:614043-Alexandrium_andersonii.AAC.1